MEQKSSQSHSGDFNPPEIKRRHGTHNQSATLARHWVNNDHFETAFFNALSAVFPIGETFMIKSVSPWKGQLPEPLNTQVENFIYQEAAHSREHNVANRNIAKSGYAMEPLLASIQNVVSRLQNMGPLGSLTGTMCIEHLTSIIAAEVLDGEHLHAAEPSQRDFWYWHAIEEVEHKAVAFDLFQYVTRDWSAARRWTFRSGFMAIIAVSFLYNRTQGQLDLLKQDGVGSFAALRGMFAFGFGKGGIGRNILRPLMRFFKPGFHPWQTDDRDLITKGEAMIAASKAAKAGDEQQQLGDRREKPRFKKAA